MNITPESQPVSDGGIAREWLVAERQKIVNSGNIQNLAMFDRDYPKIQWEK